MLSINTITQLVVFFMFALVLHMLNLGALLIALATLLFALCCVKQHGFFRLMIRLKWFYLVMFLIFALNTPGEYIAGWPLRLSPTYEGVVQGGAQVLRISLMLAALSLILAANSRSQFISGLYFLLLPLKALGIEVERFAARLWLTLHYVELQQQSPKKLNIFSDLAVNLDAIFIENSLQDMTIRLEKPRFNALDIALLAGILAGAALFLYKAFA